MNNKRFSDPSIKRGLIIVALIGGMVGGSLYERFTDDRLKVQSQVWDCEVAFLGMSASEYGYNIHNFDGRMGKALCSDFVNSDYYSVMERTSYLKKVTQVAELHKHLKNRENHALRVDQVVRDEQLVLEQISAEVKANGGTITPEIKLRIEQSQSRAKQAMESYDTAYENKTED